MTLRRAAIVAPIRTPVGKFGGALSSMTAGQLGAVILKALMERTKIDPSRVDDVVFSQGYGNGEAPCIGHWSWLLAGLPEEVPGYQLDRRCGSGLQAIINAAMMVQTGVSDVVVAGGCRYSFALRTAIGAAIGSETTDVESDRALGPDHDANLPVIFACASCALNEACAGLSSGSATRIAPSR